MANDSEEGFFRETVQLKNKLIKQGFNEGLLAMKTEKFDIRKRHLLTNLGIKQGELLKKTNLSTTRPRAR